MHRMAEDGAGPEEPRRLVGVEVVPRVGEQRAHPGDLVHLFGEVGLHGAVGVLRPERAQGRELRPGRGGREAGRHGVAGPAPAMPPPDEPLAFIVGRLRVVPQPVGHVPVHAGTPRHHPHAPRRRRLEERVDAARVGGAVARHARRPLRQHQVEVAPGDRRRVGRIAEAHLLGEGVGVQPVDQPLAPARDDRRLRVVDVAVDEARHHQRFAVIGGGHARMGAVERVAGAQRGDPAVADQHRARRLDPRRAGTLDQRITVKAQRLPEQQPLHADPSRTA